MRYFKREHLKTSKAVKKSLIQYRKNIHTVLEKWPQWPCFLQFSCIISLVLNYEKLAAKNFQLYYIETGKITISFDFETILGDF